MIGRIEAIKRQSAVSVITTALALTVIINPCEIKS
jgi:hypothetical protein